MTTSPKFRNAKKRLAKKRLAKLGQLYRDSPDKDKILFKGIPVEDLEPTKDELLGLLSLAMLQLYRTREDQNRHALEVLG